MIELKKKTLIVKNEDNSSRSPHLENVMYYSVFQNTVVIQSSQSYNY